MTHHNLAATVMLMLMLGSTNAASLPLAPISRGPEMQVTFQGPIPTETSPIRGETRLAKMRQEGRLPDSFERGRCRYDLAGDPEVAYYVKTCGGPE